MLLLLYSAMAVFVFAILLNIFYLYLPVESATNGLMYEMCEDCLHSDCHANRSRPCITRYDPQYNFTCYTCDPENLNLRVVSLSKISHVTRVPPKVATNSSIPKRNAIYCMITVIILYIILYC